MRHQPEEQVDVEPLQEQQRELGFLKGGQEPLRELFAFDRHDADRGILRHTAAEDRHERLTGLARQRRSGTGIHAEIERRGDVRDAGEVDGSMAMGAGNVDEQLLGDRIRHRFIVRRHCAIQRDRRQAAGQREATESPGQGEPRKRCEAEGCGHLALTEKRNHLYNGFVAHLGGDVSGEGKGVRGQPAVLLAR